MKVQLGDKQNWVDSDDLALMHQGTYAPEFYRELHALVHAQFRARKKASTKRGYGLFFSHDGGIWRRCSSRQSRSRRCDGVCIGSRGAGQQQHATDPGPRPWPPGRRRADRTEPLKTMAPQSRLATSLLVRLGEITNRTFVLPLVVFFPTSRCNSRCVSCDWWKCSGAGDLTLDEIDGVAHALPELGTRVVVFSGGEPLLRPEVFEAAQMFRAQGMTLHLLTSGVLLERCATDVAREFSRVIVSLDATTEALYHAVRGVSALTMVEKGVARLRRLAADIPVTARATLHRLNFRELPRLIDHAKAMTLDGISFLAADVSSSAFGRTRPPQLHTLALDVREVAEFAGHHRADPREPSRGRFESGFVAESPEKLRRIPQYYAALAGIGAFPAVACNAPYASVVIEADGSVRPCFFHAPVGNIRLAPLGAIVARNLPAFRSTLDFGTNAVCTRCVCSMKTSWRSAPWQ